jgi:hypothetical protein
MKLIQYTGPEHKTKKFILNIKVLQESELRTEHGKAETTLKISNKNGGKGRYL